MGNSNAAEQKKISAEFDDFINNNPLFIFTAEDCSYCNVCLKSLRKDGIPFAETNIEPTRCGYSYLDEAMKREKLKFENIPLIYLDGKYIGGCEEIDKLIKKGVLKELIEQAQQNIDNRKKSAEETKPF